MFSEPDIMSWEKKHTAAVCGVAEHILCRDGILWRRKTMGMENHGDGKP